MEVLYLFYNFLRNLHILMLVMFVNVHKDNSRPPDMYTTLL